MVSYSSGPARRELKRNIKPNYSFGKPFCFVETFRAVKIAKGRKLIKDFCRFYTLKCRRVGEER